MKQNNSQARTWALVLFVIAALVIAIWSGVRSFGPKGRTIGHLGTISAEKEAGRPLNTGTGPGPSAPAPTESGGGLAGAPAEAVRGQ